MNTDDYVGKWIDDDTRPTLEDVHDCLRGVVEQPDDFDFDAETVIRQASLYFDDFDLRLKYLDFVVGKAYKEYSDEVS